MFFTVSCSNINNTIYLKYWMVGLNPTIAHTVVNHWFARQHRNVHLNWTMKMDWLFLSTMRWAITIWMDITVPLLSLLGGYLAFSRWWAWGCGRFGKTIFSILSSGYYRLFWYFYLKILMKISCLWWLLWSLSYCFLIIFYATMKEAFQEKR